MTGTYELIGANIGALVDRKQAAYGDSFHASVPILTALYPDGIPVSQYPNALAIVRVVDKLKRIATDNDPMGESPWADIAGYGILKAEEES